MPETLGSAVLELSTDQTQLDSGLATAQKKAEAYSKKLTKTGKILSLAITAPLIALGTAMVRAADQSEQAEARLAAALSATGQNVTELMPRYRDLASGIQNVTTIDDEAVLGLVQLGASYGIAADRMQEAIEGAIGLSKAFGVDQQAALRGVAAALGGNFDQLSRYIPALRTASSEAEKMAILQQAMAAGFGVATAEVGRGLGGLRQLWNQLGDIGEQFGTLILPVLNSFFSLIRGGLNWLQGLDDRTRSFVLAAMGIAAAMGPALLILGKLMTAVKIIIPIVTAFNVVLAANPIALVVLAVAALAAGVYLLITHWDEVAAFFVDLWEKIKVAFQTAIQAVLGWLRENWPMILGILAGPLGIAVVQIIKHWDEIVAVFQGAYDRIKALVESIRIWLTEKFQAMVAPIKAVADQIRGAFAWLSDQLVGHSIIPEMVDAAIAQMERMKVTSEDILQAIAAVFGAFFEGIGQGIADGASGWEAFKEAAKEAIAGVLRAFGTQWAIEALGAFPNFLLMAKKTLASAAAFAGAGLIKSFATGGMIEEPVIGRGLQTGTSYMLGEAGPEHVSPMGVSQEMIQVIMQVDTRIIGEIVQDLVRSRKILIPIRSVVS